MNNDLEVHCPKCGKLFKNETSLFKHIEDEHISDKQHLNELVLEIDARYIGGYSQFTRHAAGTLSLYSDPQNKIAFHSDKFVFEIPINKVKRAIPKDNVLTLEFMDDKGNLETAFFDSSCYFNDFADELLNLRIDCTKAGLDQKTANKPVVKVRCSYCKFTYDKLLDKCPHCGAMNP